MSLRTVALNFLKKHEKLRVAARKAAKTEREYRYRRLSKKIVVNDKCVVFETFMGRQYGCNPRAIYEKMLEMPFFDDYKITWVFKNPEEYAGLPALSRANLVRYRSEEYFRTCAEAKYIFTNSNLESRIAKRPGQIIFQTWHGTPLKKLRYDIEAESGNANNSLEEIRRKNDEDVVRYDYFLSPSAFATEKFISAFNLEALGLKDIIAELGYPRNDILIKHDDGKAAEIKASLGIPEDKKVILYAPTFRDNQHKSGEGYQYDLHLNFSELQKTFGEDYVILFRTHYFVANSFNFDEYEGFIYNVSQLDDIKELYLIADMLITDYSSVLFDYANLKRPMIFYMYDLERYANDIRGFYFDIEELPGKIVQTEEELVAEIARLDRGGFKYDEKYKKFNEKYNYLDDGNAAERVLKKVFDI